MVTYDFQSIAHHQAQSYEQTLTESLNSIFGTLQLHPNGAVSFLYELGILNQSTPWTTELSPTSLVTRGTKMKLIVSKAKRRYMTCQIVHH